MKVLAVAAVLGSMLGASGGTLVARLHHLQRVSNVSRVTIALGKHGAANRLYVPGVALAAGDRLQRPFDLLNKGGKALSRVALTTTATPRSPIATDRMNGLQLRITRCTKRFKRVRGRYVCPGRTSTLLRSRPVLGSTMPLPGLAGLPRKKAAHLLLTLVLPATAPNSLEGETTGLTYRFTAV